MKNTSIFNKIKNLLSYLAKIRKKTSYAPIYRITEIFQDDDEQYFVKIQMINKNMYFNAKPEEILANNELVDMFPPRDIRNLTYLGYLDINSPKYKILAKRLSEQDDKLFFALKKKGVKNVIVKSADEILNEKGIINELNPQDAQLIGYTIAQESILLEKKQKSELLTNKSKN